MASKQRPSQNRINKFKNYFNFMDVNRDGFIDDADFELTAMNMARLSNSTAEEAERLRGNWMECWRVICGEEGHNPRLTIDEAVECVANYHTRGTQEEQTAFNHKIYRKVFDIIDSNNDGTISLKELEVFYNSYGVYDDAFLKYVFYKLDDDKNGAISREEFVNAQTAYWLSDEPENGFGFLHNPSILHDKQ